LLNQGLLADYFTAMNKIAEQIKLKTVNYLVKAKSENNNNVVN